MEQEVLIDEISWSSMWAIIAALIAIWKTPQDILSLAKSLSYYKLLDTDFTLWLLKWNKIVQVLEEIFGDTKIQDTKIPLKITATNLDNWTLKIFSTWKIVDALRASFAIPWIFSPHIIDWKHYVDGWIIMNLPVQALSWENIIAVSALKMDFDTIIKTKKFLWFNVKSWFFENNFEILNRSLNLLMKTNEDISLLTVWKNIKFIRPCFNWIDAIDFDKVDQFVELGYNAIRNIDL